jgi:hypothetical protein
MSRFVSVAVVLVALVGWVSLSTTGRALVDDASLSSNVTFEGSPKLPAADIASALQYARERMFALNGQGRTFALGGDIASWVVFASTAAITLIMGWHRRAPTGANPRDLSGLSRKVARSISVLAAIGAVMTAAGSIAVSRADARYKQADAARKLLLETQRAVVDAPTAEEARTILEHLRLEIDRL